VGGEVVWGEVSWALAENHSTQHFTKNRGVYNSQQLHSIFHHAQESDP